MSIDPARIWLYRIVHVDDLARTLEHGVFPSTHPDWRPPIRRLGNAELADNRMDFHLNPPATGTIGDHVAFYLGAHSPMLYRIHTGYNVVQQYHQRHIVHLLVRFGDVLEAGLPYLITDGHANLRYDTRVFTTIEGFDHVDWNVVQDRWWRNTEADRDRERRKQAEVLVRRHIPPRFVRAIGVYDDESAAEVTNIVQRTGHSATVKVDTERKLFFP